MTNPQVVTFPNGNTYSADGSTPKDMLDGGHTEHFMPMINDTIGLSKTVVEYGNALKADAEIAKKAIPASEQAIQAALSASEAANKAIAEADRARTEANRSLAPHRNGGSFSKSHSINYELGMSTPILSCGEIYSFLGEFTKEFKLSLPSLKNTVQGDVLHLNVSQGEICIALDASDSDKDIIVPGGINGGASTIYLKQIILTKGDQVRFHCRGSAGWEACIVKTAGTIDNPFFLGKNGNFDHLLTPGYYYQPLNSSASTWDNRPDDRAGVIQVLRTGSNNEYTIQIKYDYSDHSIWYRTFVNTSQTNKTPWVNYFDRSATVKDYKQIGTSDSIELNGSYFGCYVSSNRLNNLNTPQEIILPPLKDGKNGDIIYLLIDEPYPQYLTTIKINPIDSNSRLIISNDYDSKAYVMNVGLYFIVHLGTNYYVSKINNDASLLQPRAMAIGADLNHFKNAGVYSAHTDINAKINKPSFINELMNLTVYELSPTSTLIRQVCESISKPLKAERYFDGKVWSEWVDISPNRSQRFPGQIIPIAGKALTAAELLQNRLLICNGATVSRTDFAELYNRIGTQYGSGDGSKTFGLPNFLTGDTMVAGTASRTSGALQTHSHNASNAKDPGHSHDIPIGYARYTPGTAGTCEVYGLGADVVKMRATVADGGHSHTITIGSTGGSSYNLAAGIYTQFYIAY